MKYKKNLCFFLILLFLLTVLPAGCSGKKLTPEELLEKSSQISGFRALVSENMTVDTGSSESKAVYAGNLEAAGSVRHIRGNCKYGKREQIPEHYLQPTPGKSGHLDIYSYKTEDDIWKISERLGEIHGIDEFLGKLRSVELQPYEKDDQEYVIKASADFLDVNHLGMTTFTGSPFATVVEAMAKNEYPMNAEFVISARTGLLTSAEFVLAEPAEVPGKTVKDLVIRLQFTDMSLADLQIPEEIISGAF